ncbi:MAG TPA: hypothetical protein GXZ90_01915 [Clostridiales bacterium]|nr:hypothetical protein [Clostridiales bacterium]
MLKTEKVLKNRDGVSFDLREKVAGFDNIVIENKGVVNIYCKEYYACNYSKVIEFLNQHIKTEGVFIIHTPKEENYV